MRGLLLICLICITGFSIQAQKHLLGIKTGTSISNIGSTDLFNDTDLRFGFTGGLTYDYLLSKRIRLGTDLLYLQKGFRVPVIVQNGNGSIVGEEKARFNYDYLSLPLKIGYQTTGDFKVFLSGGISPALILNAATLVPDLNGGEQKEDLTDLITRFELSAVIESGVSVRASSRLWLNTAFSYHRGLSKITSDTYFPSRDIRNRSLMVTFSLVRDLVTPRSSSSKQR